MKRVLSRNSNSKIYNEPRQYAYGETNDFKARHILGLDFAQLRPTRRNSVSTTSTNKLRSVTFSDATTAAVTAADLSNYEKETASTLSRKSSSQYLKRNKKSELQTDAVKPKASSTSLRSFYDKSRAPLAVSQQTSESSSRDFALRKGAPVVITSSTQETEHSRQLRLISMSHRSSSQLGDISELSEVSSIKFSDSPSRTTVPSIIGTASDAAESILSQPSTSRFSVLRSPAPGDTKPLNRSKRSSMLLYPFPVTKPVVDPARAKINIRRPKAGTKNWFDSLDTDSSEDESTPREPQLAESTALGMTSALPKRQIDRIPPRNSSYRPDTSRLQVPGITVTNHHTTQQPPFEAHRITHKNSRDSVTRKRKIIAFENVDLTEQSVLYLDSSDDEDEHDTDPVSSTTSNRESFRSSVMSGPWDNTRVDTSRARPVSIADSEKILQKLQTEHRAKPSPLRSAGKRTITYLEDCSTDTITQEDDLLTSFPQTPTDTHSLGTSLRDSVLSEEDDASTSTKIMTVTRQEENLIAAMRLKKTAMRRALSTVHRQGALNTLERQNTSSSARSTGHGRTGSSSGKDKPNSPTSQRRAASHTTSLSPRHSQRTDSVTTFQTESINQQSVRSSVATYLSESSEDLQLPYSISTVNGLPMSSTRLSRPSSIQSEETPRKNRDTFLSEATTSTRTASISERSPSVRESRVMESDPVNRQMLREDIPSQLFMERPFIGWEAQASMQQAH